MDTCVDPDGRTLVSSGAELNTLTDVELDSIDRRLELSFKLKERFRIRLQLDKGGVGVLVWCRTLETHCCLACGASYLEHIHGPVLIRSADFLLGDQGRILSHQSVHPAVDLCGR